MPCHGACSFEVSMCPDCLLWSACRVSGSLLHCLSFMGLHMSISVTCPACQAKLKMPETLIGKKVRCKSCQTVIPTDVSVPAPVKGAEQVQRPMSSEKANIDDEGPQSNGKPEAATEMPQARSRRKATVASKRSSSEEVPGKASPRGLPVWKKVLLYVSQRPWAAMLLFYLIAYAPIAFAFPASTSLIERLAGLLFLVGIVGGTIMALIGVSIRNPFEMLTLATIGVIAGAVMPTEYASSVGKIAGKATGKTGKRPLGEADTGVGGSIAIYSCLGLVLLFVHTMVKTMFWVAAEKAKM